MTQKTEKRAKDNTLDWESRALGRDMDSAEPVSAEIDRAVDNSLNLKPISIRLQTELIEKLKLIAAHHGIGYQPLIRSYLNRCVRDEIREMAEFERREGEGERRRN